ncbi:MAG: type I polyketide synthase, partial [Chloroflexi bacterium]|nr:type I polyketide synthase [Chloroflexota bacterium]
IDAGHLFDKIQQMLLQTGSKLLKLRKENVNIDAELSEYGFDSITLTDFANRLNQEYKLELTPTVFFEYPTIESFARYLSEEHQAVFDEKFAVHTPSKKVVVPEAEFEEAVESPRLRSRFAKTVISSAFESKVSEAVAIVGMSGQFPMAKNIEEFWNNLKNEKDCIQEIPKDRWDWKKLYGDPQKEVNKTNIKFGGFIEGVGEFDPLFFGISPREAQLMDPQQRLLMSYAWLALEDAGYSASSLSGSNTGIFIGTGNSGYSSLIANAKVAIEGFSSTGMVPSVGPNRMSY